MAETIKEVSDSLVKDIFEELKEYIPEQGAAAFSSTEVYQQLQKIMSYAQGLLKEVESLEQQIITQKTFLETESSSEVIAKYAHSTAWAALTQVMKKSYAFLHFFREWITGTSIEYVIQKGSSRQIALMTLEEVIGTFRIGVESDKGLKLVMDSQKTRAIFKDGKGKQLPFDIATSIKQIEDKAYSLRRSMEVNINKGYALELALDLILEGIDFKSLSNAELYERYQEIRKNNTPGMRGGDIDKKKSRQLLDIIQNDSTMTMLSTTTEKQWLWAKKQIEFQVKKVAGKYGASVMSISTLKAELFNIVTIINQGRKGAGRAITKKLDSYFTNGGRATTVMKEMAKELEVDLSEGISKGLEKALQSTKKIKVTFKKK